MEPFGFSTDSPKAFLYVSLYEVYTSKSSSVRLQMPIFPLLKDHSLLCHPGAAELPPLTGKAATRGWQSYHPRVAEHWMVSKKWKDLHLQIERSSKNIIEYNRCLS